MYKITGVKIDNTETDINLCKPHKTIHLLVTASMQGGILGSIQLDWDQYIGFEYNTYYITKCTNHTDYEVIDSIPTTSRTYTDVRIADLKDTFFYYISVKKADACNIGSGRKAGPTDNGGSTSQIDVVTVRGGLNVIRVENTFDLNCYPNPFKDITKISYTLFAIIPVKIQLYNELGKMISLITDEIQLPGKHEFKLNMATLGIVPGIYILKFTAGNKVISYKLVYLK